MRSTTRRNWKHLNIMPTREHGTTSCSHLTREVTIASPATKVLQEGYDIARPLWERIHIHLIGFALTSCSKTMSVDRRARYPRSAGHRMYGISSCTLLDVGKVTLLPWRNYWGFSYAPRAVSCLAPKRKWTKWSLWPPWCIAANHRMSENKRNLLI